MSAAALDLDRIIDERRLDRASIPFILVATLVLISDGFDLSAMGYVAPELARDWGLKPAAFVPAFSAGIIGMMIGGPLLGFLERFSISLHRSRRRRSSWRTPEASRGR